MPDSISLGPLLLPTQALLLVLATAAALGVLGLLRDGDAAGRTRTEARLFIALALGVLGARLGWVVQHWQAYLESPWSLLAFRDGGYSPWLGVLTGTITVIVLALRIPASHAGHATRFDEAQPRASAGEVPHPAAMQEPKPNAALPSGPESRSSPAFDPYAFVTGPLRDPGRRQLLMPATVGLLVLLSGQALLEARARASVAPLPGLEVLDMAGDLRELPTGWGRPQVINLWASWCAPCRREMPAFARVQSQRPDIDFIYLNIGESVAEIAAFTRTLGAPLAPIWRDPAAAVPERLQVRGYPTTLILDAEGRLLHRRSGELSEASLKALLPPQR